MDCFRGTLWFKKYPFIIHKITIHNLLSDLYILTYLFIAILCCRFTIIISFVNFSIIYSPHSTNYILLNIYIFNVFFNFLGFQIFVFVM